MLRTRICLSLLVALVAFFGASAFGCGERAKELRDLDGREFLSESVEGRTLVENTQIRLRFEDKNVSASAGCNSLSGRYRIEDDVLVVDGLGGTAIGCNAELHAQDSWLNDLLTEGPTIELEGSRLVVTGSDVTLVLLDREMASPDRALRGTLWKGNGFGDSGGVTFAPGGDAVSLRFDTGANEQVHVFTGCRSGIGHFVATDETIEIEQFVYDQVTCTGPAGTVDMAVAGTLDDGVLEYEIEERSLTLTKNGRLLLFRSAE